VASRIFDTQAREVTGALPSPAEARARAWRTSLFALVLLIAWILLAYGGTAMSMVRTWWRSETFAHGFIVPPIVLWLIWRRRAELSRMLPEPMTWTLAPMALASAAWFLGRLAEVNAVAQFAMTALVVLAVPAMLGMRIARALAFPLAFLFFAVPFGEVFLPALMDWTADFTIAALRLSGIPVFREGRMFVIPTGTWSVVEACSGVRYLIASLMLGTLFAYLSYRSTRKRVLFIGVSILVPIVANWVRAYLIVLIGHLSGNRLAVGVDHLIYGWVFFGFVIAMMFWIGNRWREDDEPASTTAAAADDVRAVAMASTPSRPWWVAICAMLVVGALPLAQMRIDAALGSAGPVRLVTPAAVSGWSVDLAHRTLWQPDFEGAAASDSQLFRQGSRVVGLHIEYYRDQDETHRLVSSGNSLVRSEDRVWRRLRSSRSPSVAIGGRASDIYATLIAHAGGARLLAWQFYWIDGRLTADDVIAKWNTALARFGGRDDGAAVIVYTDAEDPQAAQAVLRSFLRDEGAAILAALEATRDHR